MSDKIILRNSVKTAHVIADLETRCSILERAFSYLAQCDIIDEACTAEDMTLWARQMVCGQVTGLKQHLRDEVGNVSIFDRVSRHATEKQLADLDRMIDTAKSLYDLGIKESNRLYRYWAAIDVAEFIFYKDGCILFDREQVERRFTFSLDSNQQQLFIKKAREVQKTVAAFDKMCKKLYLRGVSSHEDAVIQKDADGLWWLDLRLLAGKEISESDVEMIDTSSLDNVRECSYELSDL